MAAFPKNEEIDARVRALHDSPWLVYVVTAGSAGGLREDLLRTPNASNTVLSAPLIYDQTFELADFIRHAPERVVSEETALRMAAAAYARGRRCAIARGFGDRPVLGVGMTSTINPGNRVKKGEHRVHVAAKFEGGTVTLGQVTFEKGRLSREEEARVCDLLTLNVILAVALSDGVPFPEDYGLAHDPRRNVRVTHGCVQFREYPLGAVGDEPFVLWSDDRRGALSELDPARHLIYPGSFDPLHHGHEKVAEQAEEMTGKKAVFQIGAHHPDKGQMRSSAKRLEQFRFRWPSLYLPDAEYYVAKARALPGFGFILGADAVLGMLNPKYYDGSQEKVLDVLEEFERLGASFYIVGRVDKGGRYRTLDDIPVPNRYRHVFHAVSGRWDISSTDLRK
jgi:cytidyltransferase-like protein